MGLNGSFIYKFGIPCKNKSFIKIKDYMIIKLDNYTREIKYNQDSKDLEE